ncbi:helix-turn-helix domain-containing protein [Streptomyces sp. Isolate_219]|uniref:helix-turn-helix domain-containing protein n=1 Tax=Streptomyces sp. Isolate_219 TaxID=2950110 RepID=UPI0021C887A2|nr:helix-turn-helix domain-containing protein [Streptomyces sp. Isolate_219]MCR8573063.1 helix-turn-helix domain-containing protein [Streptomyces sp. Isolate_219]
MSIHMMVAAAYLPKEVINKTQKLVLMKIADSADDQSRLARPGLDRMVAWAGVGEKQVITVVTELVGLGLIERVEVGRVGRRAEYRVFPYGVPPIPSTEELIERRRLAQRAPKNPLLARQVQRRKPSTPARTQGDVAAREAARAAAGAPPESGLRQGNPGEGEARVAEGEPDRFPQGNCAGSPAETPSLPSPSSSLPFPPTPTAGAAGEPGTDAEEQPSTGCPKHPAPVDNCRGCGTNPRAGREQAWRRAVEGERASQQQWLKEFFADQERRVAETDPAALEMARQRTRELARMGRERLSNSGRQ